MKTIKKKHLLTITLAIGITCFGYTQKMGKLTLIKADGKAIECSPPYAAPCIYDYDQDGLDDLIVGEIFGKFRFYKNKGTKSTPVYENFSYIQANGKDAKVENW